MNRRYRSTIFFNYVSCVLCSAQLFRDFETEQKIIQMRKRIVKIQFECN